jgi:pyruvate/2-oxoglutarate/acetoin dehydrogenase E1 component
MRWPQSMKGLMISAIRDDSPVVYMFHKGVMGLPWMAKNARATDVVPEGAYEVPIGKARIAGYGLRRRHDLAVRASRPGR